MNMKQSINLEQSELPHPTNEKKHKKRDQRRDLDALVICNHYPLPTYGVGRGIAALMCGEITV